MRSIICFVIVPLFAYAAGSGRSASFEIHGHRGARALEPENTLAAFSHALKNGATVLEADMGVSRDGHLVLNHDFEVDTVLCVSRDAKLRRLQRPLVNSLSLAQLKTYDCGSTFVEKFPKRTLRPGEPIIALSELLEWLNQSNLPNAKSVRLNLETKIEAAHPHATIAPKEFVNLFAAELKKHRIDPRRVILQSFDFRTIVYAKQRYPEFQTSALFEGESLDVDAIWKATKADYLSPDARLLTRAKVSQAHDLGMLVAPWTLNKPVEWAYFMGMGVDGLITDDPAGLARHIANAKELKNRAARK